MQEPGSFRQIHYKNNLKCRRLFSSFILTAYAFPSIMIISRIELYKDTYKKN
ncbi:hypothetical protein CLOBOL_03533 [Enterocloster bolteae ATCC BAA-613]|uniref:Uncharacterized protein n=1 Tax=Enterocloster bolteae (strain ATCC BAA-613 / DSM 15670 / CCUG 46953 / JCM 12243 / WAL 16351) TaxID=411902 RepID=A8RT34_ENTBW|nr:hypothetical protein CLOBOL_03533 [Enterocloster bolteae ATCC BAA-613]